MNSRYFNIDQTQSLKFAQEEKFLSFFHINSCSLSKDFDDPVYLLKFKNKNFVIIAVSEARISKKISLTSNVKLNNYSFESTESKAGETIACLINHELTLIYIKNKLESLFIEIISSKKSSIVAGCVYKHRNIDVLVFNSFINQLPDKIYQFPIVGSQHSLLAILKPPLIIFFQTYFYVKQYLETLLHPYLIIYPSFWLVLMCFQLLYVTNQKS